jgi:hypothetical protein
MKIKFIGATQEEDQIVEIPDSTKTVEVVLPAPEKEKSSPWLSLLFFVLFAVWSITLAWTITRG